MLSNNQSLSEQEIQDLSELLHQSPSLSIAYELKEDLRDIYESNLTVKGGLKAIKNWLVSAKIILEGGGFKLLLFVNEEQKLWLRG